MMCLLLGFFDMGASYKKSLSAGFQRSCQCGIDATQFPQWPEADVSKAAAHLLASALETSRTATQKV
jgi:hypothetical protein